MKEITNYINERINETNRLLSISNKNIQKYQNMPDIHVQSCKSHNRDQLYCLNEAGKRKYIKSDEVNKYIKLIQRDYELDVNKKLQLIQKNLKKINGSLLQLNKNDIKKAYDKLPEAKKNLIRPIIESDEEYIANWYENHKANSNTFPIDVNIYTEKGEQVRSKSEKILADLFNKHNIPYVYEPKIALTNGHMAYPDFAVLNIKERKTVYWEHLGLVDQTEYAVRNLNKISEYESTGIELGDNLIITMESSKKGFDTRSVEKKIEKFLG